jgi:hypothetical protein
MLSPMRSKLSRSLLFGAVAALLAAGVFLALSDWNRTVPRTATPATAEPEPEFPRFSPPPPPTTEEMRTATVFTPEVPAADGGPALLPPLALQSGELPWEKQVRGVLERKDLADPAKSRMLLEMVQSLPVEGRETATEEAIKRLPNTDYRVAQPMIVNPGTYGLALSVLFADLMQRPAVIKLPTLLEIARIPQHPYAGPARENLQLLLGADFGIDWNRWDAAVRTAVASGKL